MQQSRRNLMMIGLMAVALGLALWYAMHGDEQLVLMTEPVRVATSSSDDIFPESWRGGRIRASGKILGEEHRERASTILHQALAKYPEPLLAAHLDSVYVLSELTYSGVSAGGTNSLTSVYLKIGDDRDRFTDEAIERVFHAELSSILLRNRADLFHEQAWRQCNPPGFNYSTQGGVGAIKQGRASIRGDEEMYAQGFLSLYGQSSMENDFNGFAAALLCGEQELWKIAERHAPIQGKLELTVAFYHALDPSFTEERFDEFSVN